MSRLSKSDEIDTINELLCSHLGPAAVSMKYNIFMLNLSFFCLKGFYFRLNCILSVLVFNVTPQNPVMGVNVGPDFDSRKPAHFC